MRTQDIYLDFTSNPSLAEALSGKQAGDKIKLELEVLVKGIDEKGISGEIEPGTIVPEGYEAEEPDEEGNQTTPAPPPPGALTVAPVTVAMGLKKKGGA